MRRVKFQNWFQNFLLISCMEKNMMVYRLLMNMMVNSKKVININLGLAHVSNQFPNEHVYFTFHLDAGLSSNKQNHSKDDLLRVWVYLIKNLSS